MTAPAAAAVDSCVGGPGCHSSLQSATLQEKMQSNGATLYAPGMNAAEFQAKEVDKYARLVELAKLQAE